MDLNKFDSDTQNSIFAQVNSYKEIPFPDELDYQLSLGIIHGLNEARSLAGLGWIEIELNS